MTEIKKMFFDAFVAGDTEKQRKGDSTDEVEFEEWWITTVWAKYDDVEINFSDIGNNCFRIEWSGGIGFGQVDITAEDKIIKIDHEYMSKDFLKVLMHRFIEKYYSV